MTKDETIYTFFFQTINFGFFFSQSHKTFNKQQHFKKTFNNEILVKLSYLQRVGAC